MVFDMKAGTAYLMSRIESHPGMQSLKAFGSSLKNQPPTEQQLKKIFATLWAFYSETPSGIVSLALRMNDFWCERVSPWDAMEKASYLLSASVDEFGLEKYHDRYLPTHHQLFLQAAEHYKVSKQDLLSDEYVLLSGKKLGDLSSDYYREKTIAAGLGFHFASEFTSLPEFICLYEGFNTHKESYQVESDQDPGLKFFWVHTVAEPKHMRSSINAMDAFLEVKSQKMDEIIKGAMIYMDSYATLFNDLKTELTQ